jgi:hypothetical protein
MTDTTDKALDALQERLKEHDSHPESASAQADATIAALRAERDAAIAREKALLASNQEERTALVEAASLRRERDALRAQLATAQKEIDRCHARLQIAYEWRSDETGKLVKAPVADPLKHPDAVHCRDVTIELMQDQIDILEGRLATARADALREAAAKALNRQNRKTFGTGRENAAYDIACADCEKHILALIDTDTPYAPSPEAVARAALKNGAKALHEFASTALTALAEEHALQMAEKLEEMASDPATLAAIVAKAGGGE